MQEITTPLNQHYDGRIRDYGLLLGVPAKIYLLDLVGREPRSKYEWNFAEMQNFTKSEFVDTLNKVLSSSEQKGVPHIILSFPHTTQVCRYGDPRIETERETNLYSVGRIIAPYSSDLIIVPNIPKKIDIRSENVSNEAFCALELLILADEIKLFAAAEDIEEYLSKKADKDLSITVKNPNKLRTYLSNM